MTGECVGIRKNPWILQFVVLPVTSFSFRCLLNPGVLANSHDGLSCHRLCGLSELTRNMRSRPRRTGVPAPIFRSRASAWASELARGSSILRSGELFDVVVRARHMTALDGRASLRSGAARCKLEPPSLRARRISSSDRKVLKLDLAAERFGQLGCHLLRGSIFGRPRWEWSVPIFSSGRFRSAAITRPWSSAAVGESAALADLYIFGGTPFRRSGGCHGFSSHSQEVGRPQMNDGKT